MLRSLWPLLLLCVCNNIHAQRYHRADKEKNRFTDSTAASLLKEDQWYDLPIITLNETERTTGDGVFVPGLLMANRDVLYTMAAFHFSVKRFRLRGYAPDMSGAQINGLHLNDPEDGNPQWSVWSGLNEVTKNNRVIPGTGTAELGFTNLGNTMLMDLRASRQREQLLFSTTFSNRMFRRRISFTRNRGFNKKGWASAFSVNWRGAGESHFPGTDQEGGGYYFALDKQTREGHLLSMVILGNSVTTARQGPVLKESMQLNGNAFYNPYWGWQGGKKRNANTNRSHLPMLVLSDEYHPDNQSVYTVSLGLMAGRRSATALDWYHAPDPRPDYYRYLPSYQTDSLLRNGVAEEIGDQPSLLQINWHRLYDVNRNSRETLQDADGIKGNLFSGLRARYLLAERITDTWKAELSMGYTTRISNLVTINADAYLQWQQTRRYNSIRDLLGAEYSVDWNTFAENDYPGNANAIQNDLHHPNRVLREGDRYGYDYLVNTARAGITGTVTASWQKMDGFAGISLSTTEYTREGKMRNGLFPFHSYGRSATLSFTNLSVKTGINYKINGRKYLYLQAMAMSRAPFFDNIFISPRTRDNQQERVTGETILTAETGLILNSPKLKFRVSAYITGQNDGMNVLTFYHDAYRSLVNYALSGIDKMHYGTELGAEYKLTGKWMVQLGVSAGRYYYSSRPAFSVTADNDAFVLEKGRVYMKNFRVEGTPQEAYGLGLSYQHNSSYLNLFASYFREHWLAFNPIRRTYQAMENVVEGSEQWSRMIAQEKLPEQLTLDLSGGCSFRLRLPGSQHFQTILLYVGVNNLLNKKDILSGGYEQLRFDADTRNVDKFPPKYFYAMGLNYSVNISFRL